MNKAKLNKEFEKLLKRTGKDGKCVWCGKKVNKTNKTHYCGFWKKDIMNRTDQQRKGQLLVNYVRIKHKCRNEEVHRYLWNMTNKEFDGVLDDYQKRMKKWKTGILKFPSIRKVKWVKEKVK